MFSVTFLSVVPYNAFCGSNFYMYSDTCYSEYNPVHYEKKHVVDYKYYVIEEMSLTAHNNFWLMFASKSLSEVYQYNNI